MSTDDFTLVIKELACYRVSHLYVHLFPLQHGLPLRAAAPIRFKQSESISTLLAKYSAKNGAPVVVYVSNQRVPGINVSGKAIN